MQQEGSLGLSPVSGKSETRGEIGRGVELAHLHVRQNLETRAVRVIHQKQGDAIIGADIAQADVLPVTAKVGEAERRFVEYFEEAGRAAAMLHVRPTRFRDAREIEAVASLDECDFVFGESIRRPIAVEALPQFSAAVRLLGGANAWSRSYVEKSVGHDVSLRFRQNPPPTAHRRQSLTIVRGG